MKNRAKIVSVILLSALCFFTHSVSAEEYSRATAWFFKKNSEHTQPVLDPSLSFITKYNCTYVDTSKADLTDDKVLYLTFDAGYENGNVNRILDALKAENVKGSFFILENLITRNPDLIDRMYEEGHLICNHTAKHKDMSRITEKSTFKGEIEKLENVYRDATGHEMAKIYRPPEGRFSELNLLHATELGYKTVFWSFAYEDWDNKKQMDPDAAISKILGGMHNGAIILLHPTSKTNADIMSRLISELKGQGYRFETLDKLP